MPFVANFVCRVVGAGGVSTTGIRNQGAMFRASLRRGVSLPQPSTAEAHRQTETKRRKENFNDLVKKKEMNKEHDE